jgi:hypothetical protein
MRPSDAAVHHSKNCALMSQMGSKPERFEVSMSSPPPKRSLERTCQLVNSVMSWTAIRLPISMETGFSPHRELQCARVF